MANLKLPGPLCQFLGAFEIDAGTMCSGASPLPGIVTGRPQAGKPKKQGGPRRHKHHAAPAGGSSLTEADFEKAARSLGEDIPTALVRAFAEVESGGKSGLGPGGRPVIAFEGHIFRKLTSHRFDKSNPWLSYKYVTKAGPEWQHNNKDQSTAWKSLEEALGLDHDAALQSCSWGMFQVMGFNFRSCGYKNIDSFVEAMKAGESGQLSAFVGYCKTKHGMTTAMSNRDFHAMARLYNGEDYGNYDLKIERAYKKYGGI